MLINQARLIPGLAARLTWTSIFRNPSVIHFIDNDGVRDAHIKGNSSSRDSGTMLGAATLVDAALGFELWADRVPSACNIVDGPSRFAVAEVEEAGATRVEAVLPSLVNPLLDYDTLKSLLEDGESGGDKFWSLRLAPM